ncbi:hypothetical protein N7455_010295, partial [Penicillium solitum]|uniref:uncharacterized protein n=1 Tax=Penicillium solitum TaxID=60172 RepID=UPI0032C3FCD5
MEVGWWWCIQPPFQFSSAVGSHLTVLYAGDQCTCPGDSPGVDRQKLLGRLLKLRSPEGSSSSGYQIGQIGICWFGRWYGDI